VLCSCSITDQNKDRVITNEWHGFRTQLETSQFAIGGLILRIARNSGGCPLGIIYLRPPMPPPFSFLDWLDELNLKVCLGVKCLESKVPRVHTSFLVSSPTSPHASSSSFLSSLFLVLFVLFAIACLRNTLIEIMSFLVYLAFTATFLSTLTTAQTFTSCNPLNSTNCPIDTALGTNHTWDFTTGQADTTSWNTTDGTITYGTDGAEFAISKKGDAPTIQSNFYVFGGEIETWLKAAPGQGRSRT
jgi:hypothetical protein